MMRSARCPPRTGMPFCSKKKQHHLGRFRERGFSLNAVYDASSKHVSKTRLASNARSSDPQILKHKEAMRILQRGDQQRALQLLHEGISEDPDNAYFCTSAAVIEARLGNIEGARKLYSRALKTNAGSVPTLHAWGTTEMRIGNLEEAAELLTEALGMNSKHVLSLQSLALVEIKRRNYSEARDLLNYALKQSPNHVPALHALAQLELSVKDNKSAILCLEKILSLEPSNMQAITTLGSMYWKQGSKKAAREVFFSILDCSADKNKAKVLCFWAGLEARSNNHAIARQKLAQALTFNPYHISTLTTFAALEARAGMKEKAQDLYGRALKCDPNNAYVVNSFAQFLRQNDQIEEAKQLLKAFLKEAPCYGVSWSILGELYQQDGHLSEARECFQKGIGNKGDAKGALLCSEGMAELYLFLGKIDKARKTYEAGEALYQPTSRYYRMWANLEKRQGAFETAQMLYQKAHESNPQDTRTLLQWGMYERRCKNYNTAEECFLKGLACHKKSAYLWYSYATMLAEQGDLINKTRETFETALKYHPKDGPLLMEFAIFEWKQRAIEHARGLFRKGSEVDESRIHLPLLEAWIQMEKELENHKATESIQLLYNKLTSSEIKQSVQ